MDRNKKSDSDTSRIKDPSVRAFFSKGDWRHESYNDPKRGVAGAIQEAQQNRSGTKADKVSQAAAGSSQGRSK